MSDSGPDEVLIYKDLDQHISLVPFFTELLDDYIVCKESKADIVLFNYVIQHLTCILRIIKTQRCNALLIGVNGR